MLVAVGPTSISRLSRQYSSTQKRYFDKAKAAAVAAVIQAASSIARDVADGKSGAPEHIGRTFRLLLLLEA